MQGSILLLASPLQPHAEFKHQLLGQGHNVAVATTNEEALRCLSRYPIDLILADMRSDDFSIHHLLREVKNTHPQTLRVVISGNPHIHTMKRCILDGSCQLVLPAALSEKITAFVENILRIRITLTQTNLISKVAALQELPTLPSLYHQFCTLIEQEVGTRKIATLIEQDQSVAAQVLHVANSGFYNIRTASIQQAINFIGLVNIKNILLAATIWSSSKRLGPLSRNCLESLWRHASLSHVFTLGLADKVLRTPLQEDWACAGLLHGVGKVVLLKEYGTDYLSLLAAAAEEAQPLPLSEYKEFGINHLELGGYLLNAWGLPFPIIECCLFYDRPLQSPVVNKELVCLTHLASYYAQQKLSPASPAAVDQNVFEELRIDPTHCQNIIDELFIPPTNS